MKNALRIALATLIIIAAGSAAFANPNSSPQDARTFFEELSKSAS